MSKPISFKGHIKLCHSTASLKKTNLKYSSPALKEGFEDNLANTMMASFEHLNLTDSEKKQLSRSHRKMLNYYRSLNPFTLNQDAQSLVAEINHSKDNQITIEANHYGAYVCLAALYSGKISPNKKIEFILEKAPLALFPNALIKHHPVGKTHQITFRLSDDCWLSPFSSLYSNQRIKFTLRKQSLSKAA